MTYDIPEIIEELYDQHVMIPDRKDWPDYLCNNELLVHSLYSFYHGFRMGVRLSDTMRDLLADEFTLSAE